MIGALGLVNLSDWEVRYIELAEAQFELGHLPADIETILETEDLGFCVDLVTGDLRSDTDRFVLTLGGQAMAVVIGTGFCGGTQQ
jgi:hypothetical protein